MASETPAPPPPALRRPPQGYAAVVPAGPLAPGAEWRRWGLSEAVVGLVGAQVVAAVAAGVALAAGDYEDVADLPMWVLAVVTLPLQLTMAIVAGVAAWRLGGGPVRDYLLVHRWGDAPRGLLIGFAAQILLVPIVTLPVMWLFDIDTDRVSEAARDLTDRAEDPLGVVALVLVVGVMAPVAEELFFRGLLYGAFRKRANLRWLTRLAPARWAPDPGGHRWNVAVATVWSSALFAVVHGDPVLFPALFAVGVVFARLHERHGRLPLAIWAHAGFNATTLVSLLLL